MKTLLGIILAVAVLGYVGHEDYQTAKLEEAATTCQEQTAYSIPTFDQCMNNQFENNGDK